MALTQGMNVAVVRASMKKLESLAGSLDSIKNQVNSEMATISANWAGLDAQKFINGDWGYYKGQMDLLVTALRQLSITGQRQANDQEAISKV